MFALLRLYHDSGDGPGVFTLWVPAPAIVADDVATQKAAEWREDHHDGN